MNDDIKQLFDLIIWETIKAPFVFISDRWWLLLIIIFILVIVCLRVRNKFNRSKETLEARKLGKLLENYGWKVELEKYDGHKHVDIAITKVKVNIEVDGKHHSFKSKQALRDLARTYHSFKDGYITLRIPNVLVRDNTTIKETVEFINKFLRERDKQLKSVAKVNIKK